MTRLDGARGTAFRLMVMLLASALMTACAARASARLDAELLAQADHLLRQGCYDCLLEARAGYERLLERRHDAALARLFETHVLIVLRERELAIEPAAALQRAREIAAELPAAAGAVRMLEIVDAIPPDAAGTPLRDRRPPAAARAAFVETSLDWLRAQPHLPVARDYLAAALACQGPASASVPGGEADGHPLPPVAYRRAMCQQPIDAPALIDVRAAVPGFAEAALFEARAALGTLPGTDGSSVRALLDQAHARFPHSPAITLQQAIVMRALGDCGRAVELYTDTLRLRERHEEARLGRAMCLSYLGDAHEAIADATRLIEMDDLVAYLRGEASYWRAWNRHRLTQLEPARVDIERAKTLLYNDRVLTLAGVIAFELGDLQAATVDLEQAKALQVRNCASRWYLGQVHAAGHLWLESAREFSDAAVCYDAEAADTEMQRDAMAARTDLDEAFQARQLAGLAIAIRDDRRQQSTSVFNAAIAYVRGGDRANAELFLRRAAEDPARRDTVEQMRRDLDSLQ